MNEYVCTACGFRGPKRGFGCLQIGLTIFLACFALLPGILYAWYADNRAKKCPNCGEGPMIPADSPKLRK